MPLTFLHYSIAYLIGKWKQNLSLPGLVVSSMMPDIERLFYLAVNNSNARGFLHSLFGAATLGTTLSVFFTVYAYPTVVSGIFGLEKEMIKEKCRFSKGLIVACLGGGVLHVLVDSLHHEYNPTLHPFINESFDALVLFDNWRLANIIVHLVFFALLIVIFLWEAFKGTRDFWKRMLVK